MRLYRLAAGLICLVLSSTGALAQQPPAGGGAWPSNAPCDMMKRSADGSWTEAKPIISNGVRMYGNVFKGDAAAAELDQRCGAK